MVAKNAELFDCATDYDLFSNYKKIPSLISTFDFNSSDTVGSIIWRQVVHPLYNDHYNVVSGTVWTFQPTILSNYASLFAGWRGDIQYSIYFACSKFISSRVRIEWIPIVDFTTTDTTMELEGNNINKVVDINGDTLVNFTVPYIKQRHWSDISNYKTVSVPSSGLDDTMHNGMIRISLVNAVSIISGSSATNTVRAVVFSSGGDSFQVAFPCALNNHYSEILNTTTQITRDRFSNKTKQQPPKSVLKAKAHTGNLLNISYLNLRELFRNQFDSLVPGRLTYIKGVEVGEEISSFSELMRRYEFWQNVAVATSGTVALDLFSTVVSATAQRYSRINNSFMFYRGSWRLKFVSNINHIAKVTCSAYGNDGNVFGGQNPLLLQNMAQNPMIEVQVPFYFPFPYYSHDLYATEDEPDPSVVINQTSGGSVTYETYLAVGDDFKYGWPVGVNLIQYTT